MYQILFTKKLTQLPSADCCAMRKYNCDGDNCIYFIYSTEWMFQTFKKPFTSLFTSLMYSENIDTQRLQLLTGFLPLPSAQRDLDGGVELVQVPHKHDACFDSSQP